MSFAKEAQQRTLAARVNAQQIDKLPKRLRQLYDILVAKGIDLADLDGASVRKVGFWQAMHKDDDTGEAVVTDLARIELAPAWEQGPQWPVVQPATPAKINYGRRPKATDDGMIRVGIFPDPQIGFWKDLDTGHLEPMHDERAIACSLAVFRAFAPHWAVDLGDYIDCPEFSSKFASWPEFAGTMQPSVKYGHNLAAAKRSIVGPDGRMWIIAGNHDDRLERYILQNARASLRLRRADATPDDWPVMSMPNLLALDAIGCEYVDGYPAGSVKLADGNGQQTPLYAVHERGLDVVKVAKAQRQSYVQGHNHRVAHHAETYEVDGAPVDVEVWSLGCLARIDGAVPSTKGAPDAKGRPRHRIESWQHAMGLLTVAPNGAWSMEVVRIYDGQAIWRGQTFTADDADLAMLNQGVR